MMKLKLQVDELRVETFATTRVTGSARGTVRGGESIPFTVQPCPQTADDTCGMTCGHTCDPPSCQPDTVCGCV
jgi:hypothetical protein